jgi:hypothetical protein
MKKAILTFVIFLIVLISNAQVMIKLGIGPNLPVGDMSDSWAAGAQVEVNAKYLINGKIGVGVTSGYQHFFETDWGNSYDDISYEIIPIRFQGAYYFGKGKVKPYAGMELGVNLTNVEYTYYGYSSSYYWEHVDRSKARFGGAPTFGILFDFSRVIGLDISLKYNFVVSDDEYKSEKTSYISTNLGLVLKFGGSE